MMKITDKRKQCINKAMRSNCLIMYSDLALDTVLDFQDVFHPLSFTPAVGFRVLAPAPKADPV